MRNGAKVIHVTRNGRTARVAIFHAYSTLGIDRRTSKVFFLRVSVRRVHLIVLALLAGRFTILTVLVMCLGLLSNVKKGVLRRSLLITSRRVLTIRRRVLGGLTVIVSTSIFLSFRAQRLPGRNVGRATLYRGGNVNVVSGDVSLVVGLRLASCSVCLLRRLQVETRRREEGLPRVLPLPRIACKGIGVQYLVSRVTNAGSVIDLGS